MKIAYISFPPNPDKITVPMNLVTIFRVAGAFTIGIFWGLIGKSTPFTIRDSRNTRRLDYSK
jgi:hypothetical protein